MAHKATQNSETMKMPNEPPENHEDNKQTILPTNEIANTNTSEKRQDIIRTPTLNTIDTWHNTNTFMQLK